MPGDPVGAAYAGVAQLYIDLFGAGSHEHPDDLEFIAEHLAPHTGPVLDAGCGPGHLTRYLASLGLDAAGVDVVPEFVRHAQSAHPDLQFSVGSMHRLDAADHSLAGVLAWYSLIHTPPEKLDSILAELRRVLGPGGTLVVGLFDGDSIAPFDHKVAAAYTWPLTAMTDRLTRAGFSVTGSIQRGLSGDRRPHLGIAARATWSRCAGGDSLRCSLTESPSTGWTRRDRTG